MALAHRLESLLHQLVIGDIAREKQRPALRQLAQAALAVLTVSVAAWVMAALGFPSPEALSILFVLPVLFSAIFLGLGMSLVTVALSVFSYNLVLLPPVWHFGLSEPQNFAKIAILTLVALIASALASGIRTLAREASSREQVLAGVFALNQEVLGIANVKDMQRAVEAKLRDMLGADCTVYLKDEKERFDPPLLYCLENNVPVGTGTNIFKERPELFLPLRRLRGMIGVLRISGTENAPPTLAHSPSKILASLAAQTAIALEKTMLSEAHELGLREGEKKRFLAALLSSISHDFKTPLVTVIGAFSALQTMLPAGEDVRCRELVKGGMEEAQRLRRFIDNLIEISRLEAGIEHIFKEPAHLRDILAGALKTLSPLIGQQRFSISVQPDFPLLRVNPALIGMVFSNLLENAIKYGPPSGDVNIVAHWDGQNATVDIDDDGEGIAEAERESVFLKFYRTEHGDRKVAGTGLGLYICREIMKAHGGNIIAIDPHDGRGACLRVVLPQHTVIPIAIHGDIEEE